MMAEPTRAPCAPQDAPSMLTMQVVKNSSDTTDLPYATVDHSRPERQGVAEVVFGQGKSIEQIMGIARALLAREQPVLVTRVDEAKAAELTRLLPELEHNPLARTLRSAGAPARGNADDVLLVCAGTSDLPVLEECSETLKAIGWQHTRMVDVGVAGIHRLLSRTDTLRRAKVVVVVAGMEGALPSVVGGLVAVPVIAVPTSIGYGVSAGGYAALAGMLGSCASGLTVVNIDNGFGAAFAVARILAAHQSA